MRNPVLLSLLIPTRNSERTIKRCLQSIVDNHFANYEVLICDGFSTDSTLFFISAYLSLLPIRLLRSSSEGIFGARKLLIQQSSGLFVAFLDSDDELENNYWSVIKPFIFSNKPSDILSFSYRIVQDGGSKKGVIADSDAYNKESFTNIVFSSDLQNALWNKLFKAKVLKKAIENNLPRISFGEDRLIILSLFMRPFSFVSVKNVIYVYHVNPDSATRNFSSKYYDDLKTNIELTFLVCQKINVSTYCAEKYALNEVFLYATALPFLPKKEKQLSKIKIASLIREKHVLNAYHHMNEMNLSWKRRFFLWLLFNNHYLTFELPFLFLRWKKKV